MNSEAAALVQSLAASPTPSLLNLLRSSHSILGVSHVNPDGDAVGSLLGLGWILRAIGKHPDLALQDDLGQDYLFLPGAEEIIGPDQVAQNYDLIICVDASSPDRMGAVYQPDPHSQIPMVVIDHHVTNTFFGSENWVNPKAVATCQMLIQLADALDAPLTKNMALCLLTGLVTDTLGFRTENTDASVLQDALRLVSAGAELSYVVSHTLESRPFALVKLWGASLGNVQLEEGVIWTTLDAESRRACGVEPHQSDGLSNFLITVREADISATFSQRFNKNGQELVECSFRAKPGFDVSQVALSFGGGGHPPAAGCTIPGPLQEAAHKVVEALKHLRRQAILERSNRAA